MHFQAKSKKILNFYIVKTTKPIQTKFCTLIKTSKKVVSNLYKI